MSQQLLRVLGSRSKPKTLPVLSNASSLINGLFNLPTEIWSEIFTHVAALSLRTRSISAELQDTESTYQALWHDKSALSDTYQSESWSLFATRRSSILVCKAWYNIGISQLYSHVHIDLGHSTAKLQSLYHSVKKHSSLASSIIRLSIMSTGDYGYSKRKDRKREQVLTKIFPLLVNLRIFVSSTFIIRDFYSILNPEVLILYQDLSAPEYLNHPFVHERLLPGLQFASQVRTLSFKHDIEYTRHPWDISDISFPPLEFPNLVNLTLQFKLGEMSEKAVDGWILPKLRTLSVTCNNPYRWMNFIRRHAGNLEALELIPPPGYGYYELREGTEKMERLRLPKLIKLCIYNSHVKHEQERTLAYISLFIAPRLTQFSYQLPCISEWFHGNAPETIGSVCNQHHLKEMGERAQKAWPMMKELTFSYWREWSYHRQEIEAVPEEEIRKKEEEIRRREEERKNNGENSDEDTRSVARFRYVYRKDTEEDRVNLLKWLVEGWVEAGITVIFKRRQVTELVFPRKSEGGFGMIMTYQTPIWPPVYGTVYRD